MPDGMLAAFMVFTFFVVHISSFSNMKLSSRTRAFKLIEMMFTTVLIGVLGLILYALLNISTILGAKNTAVNTAHQQARVAMIDMLQDLHSAVSQPYLIDASGVAKPTPPPGTTPAPAEGIAFQTWSSGPHKFKNNALAGQNQITLKLTSQSALDSRPAPTPIVGQRVIIPTHQIESDITAVSGTSTNFTITLANNLPVDVKGTDSTAGDLVCFITDRCSYNILTDVHDAANKSLTWNWKGSTRVIGNDITNGTPFSTPLTPAGALYSRFVAAIDLSTSDLKYSNRGYKAANILLNGQVPFKARLTTYQ
jgi:type II secretory pathway pseudopilin PulG